jgi:DNA-directed RNA polymerase specialized sigma24 family protein
MGMGVERIAGISGALCGRMGKMQDFAALHDGMRGSMAEFPSTQWSLIRQSGSSASRQAAFGELVRMYHAAILAFFRARLPADTAEDATQSFLAASYEQEWWARADAQIGSFRSFLRVLLRRYLGHVRESRHTDEPLGEKDVPDDSPSADRQFDLHFALVLTARAIDTQRTRYHERGREAMFERLLPLLSSPPEHGELKAIATSLGMPANTLTVELQRLRRRLREDMRTQVRDLCADETAFLAEWAAVQHILDGG